jgi:catechol 2,3-dioxygenase-like lactoylglutathione lyase family enzyme
MSMRLDHVQVSCPPGGEDLARAFYGEALGMTEVEKPELLKSRGGCWFKAGDAEIHVGVEAGFTPAKKAHPALAVDDLDGLAAKLANLGYPVTWDNDTIPGRGRFHTADGHGNRVEIVCERA